MDGKILGIQMILRKALFSHMGGNEILPKLNFQKLHIPLAVLFPFEHLIALPTEVEPRGASINAEHKSNHMPSPHDSDVV